MFARIAPEAVWNVEVNKTYIVGGQNLTLSCGVGYAGAYHPSMLWGLDGFVLTGYGLSHGFSNDETYPGMRLRVSEINVTVPATADYLPNYVCSFTVGTRYSFRLTTSSSYIRVYRNTEYSWAAPRIKVSRKYSSHHCHLYHQ